MSNPGHGGGGGGGGGGGSGKPYELHGPCYLKLAVSNVVAGSIIGKNGGKITSMAKETSCALRLSSTNCYFPGTADRVVVISGEQENICKVIFMILDMMAKVATGPGGGSLSPSSSTETSQRPADALDASESGKGEGGEDAQAQSRGVAKIMCRVIVPKSSVSVIIGIGGKEIKRLQENTGAKIQISNREEGIDERVVHIQGSLDSVRNAVKTVAAAIQEDQNLRNHMYVEYSTPAYGLGVQSGGGLGGQGAPHGHHGQGHHGLGGMGLGGMGGYSQYGSLAYPYANDVLHAQCEVFMQIPDSYAGSVIGRSGNNLTQIADSAGARITVSQKNDFYPPDTQNRIVTIKGTVSQVHAAHIMLIQRLNSQTNQASFKSPQSAAALTQVGGGYSQGAPAAAAFPAATAPGYYPQQVQHQTQPFPAAYHPSQVPAGHQY